MNVNAVFYATTAYHPIQAGSIDGTDSLPHDNAVYRALLSSSAGLYDPTGDPKVEGDPYCSIFVGRLSRSTTEATLHQALSKYGRVKRLRLVRDIGASQGYAFVEFETETEMQHAYEAAHQSMIDGSQVLIDFNRQQLMPGWIPRRLGGGLGGRKESGQLRFGGRDRPFRAPLRPIPHGELQNLGIPLPPEGRYLSRFQIPPLPRRQKESQGFSHSRYSNHFSQNPPESSGKDDRKKHRNMHRTVEDLQFTISCDSTSIQSDAFYNKEEVISEKLDGHRSRKYNKRRRSKDDGSKEEYDRSHKSKEETGSHGSKEADYRIHNSEEEERSHRSRKDDRRYRSKEDDRSYKSKEEEGHNRSKEDDNRIHERKEDRSHRSRKYDNKHRSKEDDRWCRSKEDDDIIHRSKEEDGRSEGTKESNMGDGNKRDMNHRSKENHERSHESKEEDGRWYRSKEEDDRRHRSKKEDDKSCGSQEEDDMRHANQEEDDKRHKSKEEGDRKHISKKDNDRSKRSQEEDDMRYANQEDDDKRHRCKEDDRRHRSKEEGDTRHRRKEGARRHRNKEEDDRNYRSMEENNRSHKHQEEVDRHRDKDDDDRRHKLKI